MDLLDSLGISSPPSITQSIDSFQTQNMAPSDIFSMANGIPRTLGGIPGIGSRIPGMSSVPIPGIAAVEKALSPLNFLNNMKFGKDGEWESVHYADDLNYHHPKFKFLFKVGFYGFATNDFYYYVHRVDKPKVRFIHQDVNYYNFRTRVLTGVVYEPLTMTFIDEIGNTLNQFFVAYMAERSGTGKGKYGIDTGFGESSSSLPYKNGYTENNGQRIIIEQIFANGTQSNRFIFINPRIENFDFDELSMEESNIGSHATIVFSYDAIECQTVYGSTIHSWGNVDLLRGGGTSGEGNGGNIDGIGNGIPIIGGALNALQAGANAINHIPGAIAGMFSTTPNAAATQTPTITQYVGSAVDTVSKGVQDTLGAISSGANMRFGETHNSSNYSSLKDTTIL